MNALDKSCWLTSLEVQVERHIQVAVHCFQNMDEARLHRTSQTGGWSIVQCLDHRNSYGRYYLPHLESGLANRLGKSPTDNFRSSWPGTYLTRLMDPKTGKMKFKTVKK